MPYLLEGFWMAALMFWSMFWALMLGFGLSGVVRTFVPKRKMETLLGKPNLKAVSMATTLGAISSSCSYAAVSVARNLFQRGAHIIPALAFMIASTNLVFELSFILYLMMGWQFFIAELIGGILLIINMTALMRFFGPLASFEARRAQLNSVSHNDDGHDCCHSTARTFNIWTWEGWQQAAHAAIAEWRMIWKDIAFGMIVSGFLMAYVPASFWKSLFLYTGDQANFLKLVMHTILGPIISMLSFACSIGNIPLANVFYHGGISFGGALSFIYADLLIIPLILVYRRYFGWWLAFSIVAILFFAIIITSVIVDLLFSALGWIPMRQAIIPEHNIHFFKIDHTFWLNIIALMGAIAFWILARQRRQPKKESHA